MAQYTKEAFQALYGTSGTTFADNTTGDISAGDVRTFGQDISDSFQVLSSTIDILYKIEDDFIGYRNAPASVSPGHTLSGGWSGAGAGVDNSSYGVDSTEKCQGVAMMSTGTSSTGNAKMYSDGQLLIGTGTKITETMRVSLETLSDGTDRYSVRVGLLNVSETHGAFFRYVDNVNSGKWQAVTLDGVGVETATDTGVTADTTYHIFIIEADSAGANVKFYIDGTLVATITTNIPTSYTSIIFKILKSIGTTPSQLYADYYSLTLSRTASR